MYKHQAFLVKVVSDPIVKRTEMIDDFSFCQN